MELHPTPVNLPGLLAEIAETIRMRAEDKGMEVMYEPDPDLPEGVLTDETRLRQVLLNLLGNAVKFTDQGIVTFRVKKLETQNQSQHRIRFEIVDTGIGIPAEHLDRIFLPFEQVGDARFRSSGTGLGLTISQRIVKLMGGTIQVLSTVDTGSTFGVELVLSGVQLSLQHPISPQRTIYGYRGPRQAALIIDDHPYNRQILHKLLESVGFTCIEAEHGEQGLALARIHSPRLMLVDLVMPVMDGIEFARKIRQIPSLAETLLVAISAGAFEHQIEQSRQVGYDTFLAKPINIQEVLAVLENHLPLDWLYNDLPTDIPERVPDLQPMIVPPPDALQVLHELTLKGDLFRIKVEVDRLHEIHAAYGPFFNKVRQLAEQYQDLKLLNFLEQALKKQEMTSSMYE
jgi:CheY-like chemotaxis protein